MLNARECLHHTASGRRKGTGATSVLQAPRHVQKETGVLGLVANYHRGRLWKPSVPRPRGGEKRCCWLPSRQEGGGVRRQTWPCQPRFLPPVRWEAETQVKALLSRAQ